MPRTPDPKDYDKIRHSLRAYQIMAWVTGVFLVLVVVEMVIKYGFGYEIDGFGPNGFLSLAPWAPEPAPNMVVGVNLSVLVLIVHGYIYVVYLICSFLLVNWMRWRTTRFILIALGGVVPFLSFFVEHKVSRDVRASLATMERPAVTDAKAGAR